jgi:uncharacterized protein (DUF1778 family)
VKKNHLVEDAIQHHLLALRELPTDVIVHARIVLSPESGAHVVERLARRPRPGKKLRALMSRGND